MMQRAVMRLAAAVCIMALGACSVFYVKPLDPAHVHGTEPDCETDRAPAVADVLIATLFAAVGTTTALAADGSLRWVGVGASGIVALSFGASGIAGFRWASRCDEERRQWERRSRVGS
jgi:hypothetical protein